jgi:hypothetical protein
MSISIRRAQAFVPNSALVDDDFDIFDGNTRIGRLYRRSDCEQPWRWRLSARLTVLDTHGRANSRVEALNCLIAAYEAAPLRGVDGIKLHHDDPRLYHDLPGSESRPFHDDERAPGTG